MQPKDGAVYVHVADFDQVFETTKHIQHDEFLCCNFTEYIYLGIFQSVKLTIMLMLI